MDSDDLSQPDRLRLQVSFLDQHREYGMVGSWFQVIDDGGKPSGPVVQCLVGNEAIKQHLLSTGNAFGHGSVMFRRELFETLGGYDETYRYSQDYDLWLRMAEKAKVENIPETLYWWRQTSEGISHLHATEQRACGERAREAAMARRLAAAKAAAERWRVEKDGLARMTCSCLRLLSRNKETLYIWGAGAAGLRAKCLLKQIHVDADAFLDSDPRKIGTTVGGLPVLSPACVAEPGRSVQSVGVVVASIAGDAIGKALEAAQHREGEDYVIIPQELLS